MENDMKKNDEGINLIRFKKYTKNQKSYPVFK